jgi:hypothetical protein
MDSRLRGNDGDERVSDNDEKERLFKSNSDYELKKTLSLRKFFLKYAITY